MTRPVQIAWIRVIEAFTTLAALIVFSLVVLARLSLIFFFLLSLATFITTLVISNGKGIIARPPTANVTR
jgi:hypothetical protein